MAVLKKFGELSSRLLARNGSLFGINRHYATEFEKYLQTIKPLGLRDMMPGIFPETEEERLKAAEKYGMHPAEYKPLPNDETGCGDYPDLPWECVEARDPYYPWDFPAMRKNYEEPLHYQFDLLGPDRFPYGVRQFMDPFKCSIIFVVFFVSSYYIIMMFGNTRPLQAEKQYPGKGIHYTFEPLK